MKFLLPRYSILIAVIIIAVLAFSVSIDYLDEQHITAKVIKTESVTILSGTKHKKVENLYLVYTDKGTFKIEDQLFFGKFNSSDLYGGLKPENTYTFIVYGFQIPIFSMYQNIKEYK